MKWATLTEKGECNMPEEALPGGLRQGLFAGATAVCQARPIPFIPFPRGRG